ncbi:MAG: hypothetical protein J0H68_01760 [Sphingobacteriia bacterium]|nr:hypothetical protein [Sphingobacteriia bacterium]
MKILHAEILLRSLGIKSLESFKGLLPLEDILKIFQYLSINKNKFGFRLNEEKIKSTYTRRSHGLK